MITPLVSGNGTNQECSSGVFLPVLKKPGGEVQAPMVTSHIGAIGAMILFA